MANQRINEAPGGALATLLAADYFLVMKQSDSIDYTVTPAVITNYIETGLTMTGTLTCDGQTFNCNQVAIDGGVIGNVTLGITGGAITNCQIDYININGTTISSTGGTDLNITPLAGQQIVLDGTIVIDAGVVTGATSITSTAITTTGNATVGGTLDVGGAALFGSEYFAFDQAPQTLTGAGEIAADSYSVTRLSLTATSNALVIEDGVYEGQIHILRVVAEIAGADTGVLSGANFMGTSLTLNHNGSGAILIWDEDIGKWYCVASNGCTYAE